MSHRLRPVHASELRYTGVIGALGFRMSTSGSVVMPRAVAWEIPAATYVADPPIGRFQMLSAENGQARGSRSSGATGASYVTVSFGRLARVENSLEAYSTASPFSEERRTPSFGSPSAHFWTTYVTFTETQPGGAGTNVNTTPLLWGKPWVAKLFHVTVASLQLSQVW